MLGEVCGHSRSHQSSRASGSYQLYRFCRRLRSIAGHGVPTVAIVSNERITPSDCGKSIHPGRRSRCSRPAECKASPSSVWLRPRIAHAVAARLGRDSRVRRCGPKEPGSRRYPTEGSQLASVATIRLAIFGHDCYLSAHRFVPSFRRSGPMRTHWLPQWTVGSVWVPLWPCRHPYHQRQ